MPRYYCPEKRLWITFKTQSSMDRYIKLMKAHDKAVMEELKIKKRGHNDE